MPKGRAATRRSCADPLLDRELVSSANGALPACTRISINIDDVWENGNVESTYAQMDGKKPVVMYKILFDYGGKAREVDLRNYDAKLLNDEDFTADTPRNRRVRVMYKEGKTAGDSAPPTGGKSTGRSGGRGKRGPSASAQTEGQQDEVEASAAALVLHEKSTEKSAFEAAAANAASIQRTLFLTMNSET